MFLSFKTLTPKSRTLIDWSSSQIFPASMPECSGVTCTPKYLTSGSLKAWFITTEITAIFRTVCRSWSIWWVMASSYSRSLIAIIVSIKCGKWKQNLSTIFWWMCQAAISMIGFCNLPKSANSHPRWSSRRSRINSGRKKSKLSTSSSSSTRQAWPESSMICNTLSGITRSS